MNLTSIVIVSYFTGPILSRCLEAALGQEGVKEVILIDNGNQKPVRARLDAWALEEPRLRIQRGHGNIGFARACNLGASLSTGEQLLLLNPDCVLPPGAITLALSEMEKYPEAWLAGCQLLNPDGSLQGGGKREQLTPKIAFSHAMLLPRFWKNAPSIIVEEHFDDRTEYVPAISGAFMLMPRHRYFDVGGMDEKYFFHVEDLDFCRAVRQAGGKMLYIPGVKVVHYRSSSKVSSLFVEWHKVGGFAYYFNKHYRNVLKLAYPLLVVGLYLRFILRAPILYLRRLNERKRIRHKALIEARQQAWLAKPVPADEQIVLKKDHAPVLLVGTTGQVGLAILRRLLAAGNKTYAIYHNRTIDYRHKHLIWVQGDIARGFFALAIPKMTEPPRTLIHTPSIWHLPSQLPNLHAMGIRRIIAFSSTSIMGKADSENVYERALIRRFNEAEADLKDGCARLGINCTILRPTLIYGLGLDRNVSSIVRFIRRFGFFPVARPGSGMRQPVHADDLAIAATTAIDAEQTYGKTYNLGGATKLDYREMVKELFRVQGKRPKVLLIPALPLIMDSFSKLLRRPEINGEIAKRMNRDLVFDDPVAVQHLGYQPRKFLSSGIADLGEAA